MPPESQATAVENPKGEAMMLDEDLEDPSKAQGGLEGPSLSKSGYGSLK